MKSLYVDQKNKKFGKILKNYDGAQLRPLFSYENFALESHSIIAWVAPCNVKMDHMVDYEDKIQNSKICSDLMLHFIIEFFPSNLSFGVAIQRLFAATVKDIILALVKEPIKLERQGDDLYWGVGKNKGKLSVSIASVSAVSTQIHFAINVTNKGTPVKTASLEDLEINAKTLADAVFKIFPKEFESILFATQKVKPL